MDSGPTTKRGNWVVGGLLIAVGAMFLLWQVIPSNISTALAFIAGLSGVGVTFLAVYLNNREHWWALIPSYVMFAVAGIIFLAAILNVGYLVAPYVMFAIAIPFLYVFVHNREHWWALIPAGIMGSIGVGLLVGATASLIAPAIPVLMIIFGVYLLIRTMGGGSRKTASAVQKSTERGAVEFEPIRQIAEAEAENPRR
jgi:hypothetical protein